MSKGLDALLKIMSELRDPQKGCPWDKEQTFATIAPHTIEEAYEVADAIDKNDMEGLKYELGDLLLQVVFHSEIASELGLFSFDDVALCVSEKMVRRHPHVYGDEKIESADAQIRSWEKIKDLEQLEKGRIKPDQSTLSNVDIGLPAIIRAQKLQSCAARVGFDWPTPDFILSKIREETDEIEYELENGASFSRLEDEVGDLFFTVINLARKLNIDCETAIRGANNKFEKRFRKMEQQVKLTENQPFKELGLKQLESHWKMAKKLTDQ